MRCSNWLPLKPSSIDMVWACLRWFGLSEMVWAFCLRWSGGATVHVSPLKIARTKCNASLHGP
jgi:hypothetical protein